jgi:hypothetical protein
MAISPNERQDRRLEELGKVADILERYIDEELIMPSMSHTDTTTVFIQPSSFYIDALFDKPSIMEDLKQRYIEKGWKDVEFREGGGDLDERTGAYGSRYITVEFIPPGVITGYMVKQYLVRIILKIILGFTGLALLAQLIKYLLG